MRDEPRLVEEVHASYAHIQRLIAEFSEKHGIAVRYVSQVASGGESSPRPHFSEEAAFLREHVEGIQFPETVKYQNYRGDPSIHPIVMKNEAVCKGQQKYLLSSGKQLERLKAWMECHGMKSHWIAQEFIESPGSAPCSFRVLVDCTGHILTSQISYGPPNHMGMRKNRAKEEATGEDPSKLLEYPDSSFFLNARSIASNHMLVRDDDTTIGGRITLNPLPISHPYNRTEKDILRAHGLDTELPILPAKVAEIASGVGRALGMKGKHVRELVLGVDILQRSDTNEFYVIEANRRPSMAPIRDLLGSADSIKEVDAWRWVINGALQRASQVGNE